MTKKRNCIRSRMIGSSLSSAGVDWYESLEDSMRWTRTSSDDENDKGSQHGMVASPLIERDHKQKKGMPPVPASATLVDVLPYLLQLALCDPSVVWRIGVAMGALVVSKAAGLLSPLYFKSAIDMLTGDAVAFTWISSVSMALVLSGVCRGVNALAKEAQHPIFTPVSQAAGRRVSFYALSHVLGLDLHFHLGRNTGALARMLERGARSISMIFRAVVFTLAPTVLELIAVCALLSHSFTWEISGIVMVTFAFYFMWTVYITWLSTKIRRDVKNLDNVIGGRAVDALLNVEAVKLSGAEMYEVKAYDEKLEEYQKASVRLEVASAALNCGQAIILAVGMTAALVVAASNATVTTGDLVMIQGLLIQLWAPLQFLGWFYRELRQSLVDMEDLFNLMKTDTRIPDGHVNIVDRDAALHHQVGVGLELKNVEFRYPGTRRRVLKGVDITAKPGESVAVVGPSGSGKSTLLRILVRMFDVDAGSVEIDGVNVKNIASASLRDAVAVVPQDTVLFNDTMLHNISYGKPDATADEIYAAVEAAKLLPALDRMPDGWDTEVGERGLKLSGGEKQRVAIARAFLKKPRLLICDEATSALDTETEQGIMASLEELASGRTSVFVAHRLSTIQGCDKIYVLKDGVVAEQGTHVGLMEQRGIYFDMWNMQIAEEALEGHDDDENSSSGEEDSTVLVEERDEMGILDDGDYEWMPAGINNE
ncbi:ABC transporter B family member 25 [Picochlorum sp. SENEW3]|nr:ABC transporter B family member 25 [Picochlorum sp. SENEW3]